ncbi:MAG: NUDIX hydrolase, associated with Thiamin pyrophosphokinase [uncultured Thiotrichaceae bacterium]|uniref:NUDIX hydrolase, associated with Thiamin pyrophosphokinase n=1 Tax=uncultured Thiotrichaceae bacterium TaxID=298394 RepID=A0A6S6TNA0_9GAMM|nr:MAG: NUDIX hydrolase, associated with Thiamin pyrophosphokinase [uncultured Thiotrichaceae bacterium]
MSYLDRIRQCNQYDLERCIPFYIEDEQLGWTEKSFLKHLEIHDDVFNISDQKLSFHESLDTVEARSDAIQPVLWALHQQGVIDTWVDELYPIVKAFEEKPRLLIERASTHYFGVKSFGVHINGLVDKDGETHIWIAKRALDKPFWPGMLDQVVAGGQPFGISLIDNVVKECQEEADIPLEIARKAELTAELHYCSQGSRGINPDTLYVYDLWLPEDFVPRNTDGEVESFELWSLHQLRERTENTAVFKDNCNLVNIDLLIRLGMIDEKHKDYGQIKNELYAQALVF